MRSFLLLLVVDLAIVAGGIALFGHERAAGTPAGDVETVAESRRLVDQTRTLRREAQRLEEEVAALTSAHESTRAENVGSPPAAAFPDEDLDRLEVAIRAVEERRARERGREGLLIGVRHVYPDLSEDQQQDVAKAIGTYRERLEAALRPGGAGALGGHEEGVREMRRLLVGVVSEDQANEIGLRYAIRPGPPSRPPVVSPPVRRK